MWLFVKEGGQKLVPFKYMNPGLRFVRVDYEIQSFKEKNNKQLCIEAKTFSWQIFGSV